MSIRFAVLGDSIAYGQGAAARADTPGERLVAALATAGTAAELRVFAVPGARSQGLATQVTRAVTWRPALSLIVIGANDLTRFVPAHEAAADLGAAVRALTEAGTQVVVAPAPDLSIVPWVPTQVRGLVQSGSTALRQAQTAAALAAGALVADTGASALQAFAADPRMFSADRFHPSSAGYALIAQALAPAVLAAASRIARAS